MDIAIQIINRFNSLKSNTERSNFESRWQAQAEYCSPMNDNINTVTTAGERKPVSRLIDIGIRSNRIFTSGLSSNLTPAGARFFDYTTTDAKLKRSDAVTRYFTDVTEITYDILNSSNFFQEFSKCLSHLGYVGTCCILAEPSEESPYINFRSYFINQYYIAEDAYGCIDTVYFELKMTARQVYQLFGDKCSDKIKSDIENPNTSDKEHIIIHAIEPRVDYIKGSYAKDKRPIRSCYVEMEGRSVLKEDGYYEMPFSIGRFYQSTNEIYGRGPADECMATLSMVNAMERTRIQSAQRAANPPWLMPNDGSVRRISNEHGAVIQWDASNPHSKPEQLMVRDNIMVNEQMIADKSEEIEDAFYVPLFNPLNNRQNMTATESTQRMNIALQNLVPSIGRLTNELLQPMFERIYQVLRRQGVYPEMPDEIKQSAGKIKVGFSSKATMAIEQLKMAGTYQTMENITFLAQFKPEILDNFNFDEIARNTAEANSMPTDMLKSERDVAKDRKARAEQQAQAQQAQQMSQMAEVYNKTSATPEAGSGADMLMRESGL